MPVKLCIKVTRDILKQSMYCGVGVNDGPFISTNCAIALAVRDIFPNAVVLKEEMYFASEFNHENNIVELDPQYGSAELPQVAQDYIELFDYFAEDPQERLTLPELEFDIEIPDEALALINIEEVASILVDHPNLQLVH